jgi:RNA polymerase sigma-70 factor, ECF subfamily
VPNVNLWTSAHDLATVAAPNRPERLLNVPRAEEPPASPPASEENDWLTAAQQGDRSAYARLVNVYWDRMFRWLFHVTHDRHRAEDLTQETFLKALAAIKSFRVGSNFRAWLYRIAHNNFVNLKRGDKRKPGTLPEESLTADNAPGPVQEADDRETLKRVTDAIGDLPAEFRTALLLRADEGMNFRDIAAVMGITEETARWRVFKARQKLVKLLGEDEPEDVD